MAEAVVSFVSEAIDNFLILEDRKSLHGTRELVEELKAELSRILLFLKDADARAVDDDKVRIWISQVRYVAYDIEDVLEHYVSEVGSRRNVGFVGAIRRVFYRYFRRKVRSELQALNTRIPNLRGELESYRIGVIEEGGSSSSRQQLSLRTYSFVVDEDIVGLERDVDLLVQRLVSEDEHRVVSICGMGGLGKTTLAREVYRHPTVRRYFDGFAWICVSKKTQARDILKGLITQLVPAVIESLREDEEICTALKQKRCLVVLDDIWRTDAWEYIKHVFPTEQNGSKILVTTRIRDLVFRMDSNGFLYEKPLLSEDKSWELFQRKALRGTDVKGDMNMDVERLGRKMIRFCGDLPLTIAVLAGSLSGKSSSREWKDMYQKLRCSRDTSFDGGTVLWILSLCYNDLPPHLKLCFLYLGSFPEDTDIKTETLYQMWIAEGLVENPREEESMMDLAENYLGELAGRGMVQVLISDVPKIRRFESCRLHDIMRDLCLLRAKEENFFKSISSEEADEQFYSITTSSDYKLLLGKGVLMQSNEFTAHTGYSQD